MASFLKRAQLYLGLGPDDEYEEYDEYDDPTKPPAATRRSPRLGVPGARAGGHRTGPDPAHGRRAPRSRRPRPPRRPGHPPGPALAPPPRPRHPTAPTTVRSNRPPRHPRARAAATTRPGHLPDGSASRRPSPSPSSRPFAPCRRHVATPRPLPQDEVGGTPGRPSQALGHLAEVVQPRAGGGRQVQGLPAGDPQPAGRRQGAAPDACSISAAASATPWAATWRRSPPRCTC